MECWKLLTTRLVNYEIRTTFLWTNTNVNVYLQSRTNEASRVVDNGTQQTKVKEATYLPMNQVASSVHKGTNEETSNVNCHWCLHKFSSHGFFLSLQTIQVCLGPIKPSKHYTVAPSHISTFAKIPTSSISYFTKSVGVCTHTQYLPATNSSSLEQSSMKNSGTHTTSMRDRDLRSPRSLWVPTHCFHMCTWLSATPTNFTQQDELLLTLHHRRIAATTKHLLWPHIGTGCGFFFTPSTHNQWGCATSPCGNIYNQWGCATSPCCSIHNQWGCATSSCGSIHNQWGCATSPWWEWEPRVFREPE